MTARYSNKSFRIQPVLENLEDRKLLSPPTLAPGGKVINNQDLAHYQFQKANNVPLKFRRIAYTTPQGSQVILTLYGSGSLQGTTVRPDGAVDIVYSRTNNQSKIVGHVINGTGFAPLGSIRDAAVVPGSPTAVGSEPINVVNLSHFDLVPNGYINLEGGIGTLALHSAAANSQIHTGFLVVAQSAAANTNVSTAIVTTNTGSVATTSGTSSSVVTNVSQTATTPTGSQITILTINGAPRETPIGDAQIYGFDPTTSMLVRFDAVNGNALQSIAVPASSTIYSGVGLGRNNGRQVVLVGSGSTVFAYDVGTGAAVGSFGIASLAANGLTSVDGIGSSDTRTFISDSPHGLIQSIDVTASLATGQAVPLGAPFPPAREFELSGGVTGLAGSDVIYVSGAAHFDTFTPDRLQLGILSFTPTAIGVVETSRVRIPGILSPFIDAGPPGFLATHPTFALGSIAGNLALDTGVVNGKNSVTLFSPSTTALTNVGSVALNEPNLLTGLSESFHPELLNGVLLDVTGNLRSFVATEATGLVVNSSGTVNLVQIKSATDTAIIGQPLNHVNIPIRNNVTLLSSARGIKGTGTNGGVNVRAAAKPLGVLTLP
jgi:hypothetical protein